MLRTLTERTPDNLRIPSLDGSVFASNTVMVISRSVGKETENEGRKRFPKTKRKRLRVRNGVMARGWHHDVPGGT